MSGEYQQSRTIATFIYLRCLIIEFDQLGNITALEEFATVKLYNR
jgi:hypothetical protein